MLWLQRYFFLLIFTVGCAAQPAPAGAELPVNRRVENQIRSQFNIPPNIEITIGDLKPSDIAGFDTLPVTLKGSSATSKSVQFDFLISKDRKTLARLEKYDISTDVSNKIDLAGRPVRGNKDAKVTIVNYDDFQCPFCARMHQTLNQELLHLYGDNIKIIYKDYPLYSIHPWAVHAAVDANCLNQQSNAAYWDFADYVHGNQANINAGKNSLAEETAELDRIAAGQAKKHKLDEARLQACTKAQDETAVRASSKEGDDLGVDSTPTMFINGEKISGAVPTEAMLPIINRALRDAGVPVPATAQAASAPAPEAAAEKPKAADKK